MQRRNGLKQRVAVGLAGGLLGALAMNLYARAIRAGNHGIEAEGAAPGRDRDGRGMQPPQACIRAEEDAAVQVGSEVYRWLTGREPNRETRTWLGSAAHYAFGGTLGVLYGAASHRAPAVRAGFGLLYGTMVWIIADEGAMPALGLSRGPGGLPTGVHAYALAGHWVYGATLEGSMRLLTCSSQSTLPTRASHRT